jgi:ribosomal protein L16 Arg81 hydroxylase
MAFPRDNYDTCSWLLAPLSRQNFLAEYFGKQPLVITSRDTNYYEGLFSLADLEQMVFAAPELVAASTRVISHRHMVPLTPGASLLGQLRAAFQDGCTIDITSVQRFVPAFAHLARRIEAELDMGEVRINLYLSAPGAKAFPCHADRYDIFVLQLIGHKQWKVYDPRPELVPASLRLEPPPVAALGAPVCAPQLKPGSLLYIPQARFHEAWTLDDVSLHVSIGVYPFSGGKLLLEALQELADTHPDFLEDVSRWSGPERQDKLSNLLSKLAASVDLERRLHSHRLQRLASMPVLPAGFFADRPAVEAPEQLMEKRRGMICSFSRAGGRVCLHFPGSSLEFPEDTADALRFIAAAQAPFCARDLAGDLSPSARLVLLRRLVKEGLLTPSAPAAGS